MVYPRYEKYIVIVKVKYAKYHIVSLREKNARCSSCALFKEAIALKRPYKVCLYFKGKGTPPFIGKVPASS